MQIQSVVILGSGNVATQFGLSLQLAGILIKGVYSQNLTHASELALMLNCGSFNHINQLPDADLYLIAVADEAIGWVANQLNKNAFVVHTSGVTPLSILNKHAYHGVFYPLQTLNKSNPIRLNDVPILVEANNQEALKTLDELGSKMSSKVVEINTQQRQYLHLAAVFTNNFTNHLIGLGRDLLIQHNLPPDMLHPLIKHTFEQALLHHPKHIQTGPVVRGDYNTIGIHIDLIKNNPDLRVVYETLSNSISKTKQQQL